MSANQIDQLFKQTKMPAELKQRYAKRLLQFKHAKIKHFKTTSKHPNQDHGNYISQFKGEQIKRLKQSNYTLVSTNHRCHMLNQ